MMNLKDLSARALDMVLITQAKTISLYAHAPCSGFQVGAALLVKDPPGDWRIITGINYESLNYKSTCAEQNALAEAQKTCTYNTGLDLLKIAIYSPNSADLLTPCGNCRQLLGERNPDLEVICTDASLSQVERFRLEDLLPQAFKLNSGDRA